LWVITEILLVINLGEKREPSKSASSSYNLHLTTSLTLTQAMFDILEADIVVMQEAKIQQKDLHDDMVLVPGWDVFFSLPKHKKGTTSHKPLPALRSNI
jgi:hypothetical protein